MAIYHCSIKTISRGQGRSAVGAAAYRAGEDITNEKDGVRHDYTRKDNVVHKEIVAPENAPDWVTDRSKLWNAVEQSETRKNSRTAREIEVALPTELSREQQIELVRDFVKEQFVKQGMVADITMHDKKDGNPHAHILLTTREIDENGFTKKNREWDKNERVDEWRKGWEVIANRDLERAGCDTRIDHRSHEDRGLEEIPQIHVGHVATSIEKKQKRQGKQPTSERGDLNREIIAHNKDLQQIDSQVAEIENLKLNVPKFYHDDRPDWEAKVAALVPEAFQAPSNTYTFKPEQTPRHEPVRTVVKPIKQQVETLPHVAKFKECAANGMNDQATVKTMLISGFSHKDIASAVHEASPNAPARSDDARKYTQKLIFRAEKEIKIENASIRGGGMGIGGGSSGRSDDARRSRPIDARPVGSGLTISREKSKEEQAEELAEATGMDYEAALRAVSKNDD